MVCVLVSYIRALWCNSRDQGKHQYFAERKIQLQKEKHLGLSSHVITDHEFCLCS